jgi:hypothetical protein
MTHSPRPITGHAYARTTYRVPGGRSAIVLTAADAAALDPDNTGQVDIFGVTFTRDRMMHGVDIDAATAAAYETLVWSSSDTCHLYAGEDAPAPETLHRLRQIVAAFVFVAHRDLDGMDAVHIGHDIILTANRHGAGFWDRGLGERGDRLTAHAHALGEISAYIGDDNLVHVEAA